MLIIIVELLQKIQPDRWRVRRVTVFVALAGRLTQVCLTTSVEARIIRRGEQNKRPQAFQMAGFEDTKSPLEFPFMG